MTKKKRKSSTSDRNNVDTGGGAYVGGNVDTGGGTFVGRDQTITSGDQISIEKMFEPIYRSIDSRAQISEPAKKDLTAEVQEVETEIKKGEQADPSFLSRRLHSIGRMAPDILEVILSAATGPAAVISTAVKKVMEKVKSESKSA